MAERQPRRKNLAVSLALFVLVTFAVLPARAQTRDSASSPVGTWVLESSVDTLADGSLAYWMGRNATGLIVYSASGHVSVQFQRDPRPASPTVDGYYSYYGTYQLNAAGDSVAHTVQSSMRPAEIGVTYRRAIRLSGDRLIMSLHIMHEGVPRRRILTWRRASAVSR